MSLCTSNLHPSSSLSISSPTTTTPQNHLSALSGSPPLLLLLPLLLLSVSPPPTTPLALLSLQTISKAANFGFVVSRQSPSPLFQLLPAVTAALIKERVIVLVIGTGGREHALCHALKRSPSCNSVLCAPGNPGITSSGDATCVPDLDVSDSSAVISFCRKQNVGLVVVGPEVPLDFDRITEMRFYSQLDFERI
ncbi:unnamed protein product [Brassica rapa]|uniref:Phosphoribosylglycinamide synthetase N-terminal domain-containing protein n=1 Tax=Brassica campestris TaxID=3711 RepID=A0A8D9GHW6_BRACM|nr:unnamed protein product [Brassica rapa]